MSRLRSCALALSLPVLVTPFSAKAQEEVVLPPVVIYANQVPLEASKVGSAVTVVTEQQIQERGQRTLVDVLRSVPGVAISQNGSRGSLTQVRMRGAEGNHVLVLVDGVQVNSLAEGEFNFADFLTDDVERIEVIRGPQSGIYGSAAHAGVISIVTKSGRGQQGASLTSTLEAGTQETFSGSATLRGGHGPVYGAISAQGYGTQGFNISRFGTEEDASRAASLSSRLGVDFNEHFNLEGSLRYTDRQADFDGTAFAPGQPTDGMIVDRNNVGRYDSASGRVAGTFTALDGNLRNVTSADFLTENSRSRSGGATTTQFQGNRQTYTNKTSYSFGSSSFGERHTVTGLVDHQIESFNQTGGFAAPFWEMGRERERTGVAGEYLLDLPFGTTVSAAARHDWNDQFDDATTWRLTGAHTLARTGTRFHASVGTGITNPGFFEMFGLTNGFVGNPSLTPEKSLGFDAGVEQSFWNNRLTLDVTYFRSKLENEINTVFAPVFTAVNVPGISDREGFEVSANFTATDWLDISGNYTYTLSEQPRVVGGIIRTSVLELRRPRHTGSLYATARFLDNRLRATVGAAYTGDQLDSYFFNTAPFSSPVTLPAYTLVSANVDYDVTKQVTVFARAENLFDVDHEDVFSYQSAGAAAYAGLRIKLGVE